MTIHDRSMDVAHQIVMEQYLTDEVVGIVASRIEKALHKLLTDERITQIEEMRQLNAEWVKNLDNARKIFLDKASDWVEAHDLPVDKFREYMTR